MKSGRLILWNADAVCEMFKTPWQMGEPLMRYDSEIHFMDRSFRSEQWLNIFRLQKDQLRLHQFGKNVLPGIFFGYALVAERIWEGDVSVADTEQLEKLDASEIHARRPSAKEITKSKKGEFFTFPIADGTGKLAWKRSRSPRIHCEAGTTSKD